MALDREMYELLRSIDKKITRLETQWEQFDKSRNNLITRDEFEPVKRLVYGVTGLILVGVVVALLALVVQ